MRLLNLSALILSGLLLLGCTSSKPKQGECSGHEECDDLDPCNGAETCDIDTCVPGTVLADGTSCGEQQVCLSEVCVDSECEDDSDCDDGNPCNGTEVCMLHVCQSGTNATTSATCTDGDQCTENDHCDGVGGCTGNPVTCVESDGNPCTVPPVSCDPATVCQEVAVGDSRACEHDGDLCTVGQCDGAVCDESAKNCSDDLDCTEDSCEAGTGTCLNAPNVGLCAQVACQDATCNANALSPGTGCEYTHLADWTACSDGNSGSVADTCRNGTCVGATVTNTVVCTNRQIVDAVHSDGGYYVAINCSSDARVYQTNGSGLLLASSDGGYLQAITATQNRVYAVGQEPAVGACEFGCPKLGVQDDTGTFQWSGTPWHTELASWFGAATSAFYGASAFIDSNGDEIFAVAGTRSGMADAWSCVKGNTTTTCSDMFIPSAPVGGRSVAVEISWFNFSVISHYASLTVDPNAGNMKVYVRGDGLQLLDAHEEDGGSTTLHGSVMSTTNYSYHYGANQMYRFTHTDGSRVAVSNFNITPVQDGGETPLIVARIIMLIDDRHIYVNDTTDATDFNNWKTITFPVGTQLKAIAASANEWIAYGLGANTNVTAYTFSW